MSKRDDILDATRQLFWERGFQATSPRDIQEVSGAGQGSFYHHFRSKRDLAIEAMNSIVDERIAVFDQDIRAKDSIIKRIERFLSQPRAPLKGCKLGRMVWDSAVDDPSLQSIMASYFNHTETTLIAELKKAESSGKITLNVPAEQIALMVIAMVQGGFTISRGTQVRRHDDISASITSLLHAVIVEH